MWSVRATLELGMELAANHERMILDLDDFHNARFAPLAREHEPFLFETFPEVIVEFVAVTVTLGDGIVGAQSLRFFIRCMGFRAFLEVADVLPEPERASHTPAFMLIGEEVHDILPVTELLFLIELLTRKLAIFEHRSRKLDCEKLRAETQPEIGHVLRACMICRKDLSFDAARTEAARHDDAGTGLERLDRKSVV